MVVAARLECRVAKGLGDMLPCWVHLGVYEKKGPLYYIHIYIYPQKVEFPYKDPRKVPLISETPISINLYSCISDVGLKAHARGQVRRRHCRCARACSGRQGNPGLDRRDLARVAERPLVRSGYAVAQSSESMCACASISGHVDGCCFSDRIGSAALCFRGTEDTAGKVKNDMVDEAPHGIALLLRRLFRQALGRSGSLRKDGSPIIAPRIPQ